MLSAGDLLGPYEIVAPLGAGGMGEVYRARDPRLHREVAIKVAFARFNERSAREARTVAALNHPNICHVYDVGPDYLVMELVEGETLAERIQHGSLPLDEALNVARQIGAALEAAHEKGVVHRDLKPSNIKIRPDGTVKVLDFGLAKVGSASISDAGLEHSPTVTLEQATRVGAVVGTAAYMAPEQARGKPVDKRADIWAFAVVLYEMLTGERMFQGETISDTLAAVLTVEPEWDRVPAKVRRLLRQCLEKDPARRLRDIGDAALLLDDPPAAVPSAPAGLRWKIAAGVLAAALLAALALLWQSPRSAPALPMRLSVDLGPDAAVQAIRGAPMDLSPDGSRLVFIVGEPIENDRLALRRLDQPKAVPLPGTEGAEAPFFSPDGRYICFFADRKLKKIDTAGGAPVTLCDIASQRGGSWGDDDNIVLPVNNRSALFRVSAGGGVPQPVTRLDAKAGEDSHRYPQVLPGAAAVLFMNSLGLNGEGSIQVHVFKTNASKTLIAPGAFPRYLPSGHLVYWHAGTLYAAPMDLRRLELTGSPVPLLEDVSFQPGTGTASFAFSKSGTFVYAAASPENQVRPLQLLDEKDKLEPLPVPPGSYTHVRVSPDGARLAVTLRQGPSVNIWIYEWATHRFSQLAFPNGNSDVPVWTADGKYLAFFSDTRNPGPGIYITRTDATGAPHYLVPGPNTIPNSFSANAARIVYEVGPGSKTGLWLAPLDWSDPAHPKPGAGQFFGAGGGARFSPDGKWIAYVEASTGLPEVFVRPLSGAGGPWQVSAGGDYPVWSQSTRELFYTRLSSFHIMAAAYAAPGDSFSPSPPRTWSGIRANAFDLMPDGRRAVVVPSPEQKAVTHATFLFHFVDDLRRRIPARN